MRNSLLILLVAVSLSLGACGKKPKADDGTASQSTEVGSDTSGADSNAANAGVVGEGSDAPGPMEGVLAKRIIYFDFDSSEVRGDGTEIVAAHARYLASNTNQKIRLEGHTDERGSREYNIGLGERRAQAVRRALMLQGAGDVQLATVSYGEERPAAASSDEAAWSQNRRVEIVYLN